ncbi:MAG: hypothetical protein AAGA29_12420 [Planctomycetota bacterium]
MSVRDRIDDARLLYANGRKDGALLSVLVAVSATSRMRYPRNVKKDREAFLAFLQEELVVATHGGTINYHVKVPGSNTTKYPDEMMPIQNVFYEIIRCNLAHEAVIPNNIRFETGDPSVQSTRIEANELVLSDSWIDGLAKVVEHAPENHELYPNIAALPDDVLAWVLFGQRRDKRQEYMAARTRRLSSTKHI